MKKYLILILVLIVGISGGCIEKAEVQEQYEPPLKDKISEKFFGRDIEIKAPQANLDMGTEFRFVEGRKVIYCTGSMIPTFDCNHKIDGYFIKEHSEIQQKKLLEKIRVGEVIIFSKKENYKTLNAIHRIVFEGYDEQGRYFITKGDNNEHTDEGWYGKVREDEIEFWVRGVWY
jgi:hypothetical protein